tara:strand:- start:1273 stop:2541 length:1269 start_codon:yes stop_codon:yes gene_type:complete
MNVFKLLVLGFLANLILNSTWSSATDFIEYKKRYAPKSNAMIPPDKATLKKYESMSGAQRAIFMERYFSSYNYENARRSILIQVDERGIDAVLQIYPLQIVKQFNRIKTYEVIVPYFTNPDDFVADLKSSFPGLSAEKNIEIQSFASSTIITDAFKILQWDRLKQSITADFGLPNRKVKVGVLDTGIENHIDLPPIKGATRDLNGHGTHVAGLIGAVTGNRLGADGITSEAILANYPVIRPNGKGNLLDLISALMKAWRENCEVLQLSIGTYEYSRILYDTLTFLAKQGIVLVAAAGNDSRSDPALPAMHPLVIGVGSHDSKRNQSKFSNKGINQIVSLPGENILSTLPNNQFGPMTGTSMAAPMLSGILVELLARRKTNIPIRRLLDVFAEHAKEVNAEKQTQHSPFDGYVFVKLYKPMHQ